MKNKQIIVIQNILSPLQLDIEKSSARRRFLRVLKPFIEDINAEVNDLRKKYADKNPDGSLKLTKDRMNFTKENQKKLGDEFGKLDDLDIEVKFTGNEKDAKVCAGIIEEEIKKAKDKYKDKFTAEDFEFLEMMNEALASLG